MANSAEYTAEAAMVLARNEKSMKVVSTLLRKCVLLGALALYSSQKVDEIYGVGEPALDTITAGLMNDPIRVQESQQSASYEPLIHNIIQHDYKRSGWRDTVAVESSHTGTDATFTITVANGVVTAVAVAGGGTGYAGSPPTLILVDAVGSGGHNCVLIPTMSGGAVASVAVANGGTGYAASGTSVIINVGYSEGEEFARPIFHWSEIDTIGFIYDRDKDSAIKLAESSPKQDTKGAILDLTGNAIVNEISNQAQTINQDLWTGTPTSESALMWDSQYGLVSAIDDGGTTTVYAGVDRTIAANYWWRSIVDSSVQNGGLSDLVDDANLTKGLSELSGGVDLFVVPLNLLAKYKKEGVAQLVNANTDDRMRQMAQYGFTSEVLKYGNSYIIGDGKCPAKTVLGINTNSLLVQFKDGRKFSPTQLYDMKGQSGGKKGHKFHVYTEWMLACVAPNTCVKYTNVT